ncbi:hypothetical protein QUA13_10450 [Microcoleus sp. S28C3]|uniref:hypothetical protein n=1 Tax=unclassified Microcoleus TaxID=2642155 RepID=UPI002FD3FB99
MAKFLKQLLVFSLVILLASSLFITSAEAANRKGSTRKGGSNSHGKGSHYEGGHFIEQVSSSITTNLKGYQASN